MWLPVSQWAMTRDGRPIHDHDALEVITSFPNVWQPTDGDDLTHADIEMICVIRQEITVIRTYNWCGTNNVVKWWVESAYSHIFVVCVSIFRWSRNVYQPPFLLLTNDKPLTPLLSTQHDRRHRPSVQWVTTLPTIWSWTRSWRK